MKSIMSFLIIFLIFSCKQKEQQEIIVEENMVQESTQITEESEVEEVLLKNFTYEDVARYTISSVMQQSPEIMRTSKKDDLYFITYIRKSDKQKFEYKIKFEGNNILWANIDGRWRNSLYDEKLSFVEKGDKLKVIQTYSDGSEDIQEYSKGE